MNKVYSRNASLALMVLISFVLSSVLLLSASDTTPSVPSPPVAKKVPKITEINGRRLVDNYYWLRDKQNPDVRAYLEAENAYADSVMKPTEALQKKLYDEMLSRIKETDVEVPYKFGDYFYYTRTEAGKQYPIRCRRKGSMDAPEEVVLDLNELGKGQVFISLGSFEVSDDGNLLAYTTDNIGFRQFTLSVKDLRTGKTLPEHAERVGSVAWANDNKTIFYTVEDAVTKREFQLYRHPLGSTSPDPLVYEEKDEHFETYVGKTRSRAFLILYIGSHTTSEARFVPASDPMANWKLMEPRKQDVRVLPRS